MPYNNAPIPPPAPEEMVGHSTLPIARVKRIIDQDEELGPCSKNASFAIAIAAEMFVQHLAQQAHHVARTERKPRRNIQYRDMATAVARVDNLEFLSDVVPRTMSFKEYKESRSNKARPKASAARGQMTLDGHVLRDHHMDDAPHADDVEGGSPEEGTAMVDSHLDADARQKARPGPGLEYRIEDDEGEIESPE